MKNTALHIKSAYGTSLNSREAAIRLCHAISRMDSKHIELDFTDVEFMSRSFADQFHKERQTLRTERGISIFLINANEEVNKILEAVGRTQDKKDRKFNDIQVLRFSNLKDVSNFLLSI